MSRVCCDSNSTCLSTGALSRSHTPGPTLEGAVLNRGNKQKGSPGTFGVVVAVQQADLHVMIALFGALF